MTSLMTSAVLVAGGGALGSLVRWSVGVFVARFWPAATFPWATLMVNLTGSFLFGVMAALAIPADGPVKEPLKLLVLTGFLGGFTTFSAFSLDVVSLAQRGELATAMLYAAISVVGSIAGLVAGLSIAKVLG